MAFPERRTTDILLTILLFAAVCALVYSARRIILVFFLAVVFAYLIDPVVKFLQRHSLFFRNLRGPAVVEVYLAIVLLMALTGYTFAPGVARNTARVVDQTPTLLNDLSTGDIATQLRGEYGWTEEQEARLRFFLAHHKNEIEGMIRNVDHWLSNGAQILGWLLLIPVLAIFFLRDGDHIADVLIQVLCPSNWRPAVRAIAYDLHIMLTQYIRAQVTLCALSFLFYSAVLLLLRFPHPIALGMLGGLLEFVPVVGWMSTFAVIVGVGVANHSHWLWMAALLAIWRMIQDYYAAPKILGRELKIHPLAAIFAVLVGGQVGGIVGIYLAVPLIASMRVIWRSCGGEPTGPTLDREGDVTTNLPAILAETATP